MNAFDFDEQMNEISGLGGEVERACRAAVCTGATWWLSHPQGDPVVDGDMRARPATIHGVNDEGRSLIAAIRETPFTRDDGAKVTLGDYLTHGMYYLILHHVMWIGSFGWKWYVEKMSAPFLIVNEPEGRAPQ